MSAVTARNACSLLGDAELLASSGRSARAYALAVLATEESAKAVFIGALAGYPDSFREQAPLHRLLEWHALKLVGGLMLAVVPFGNAAARIAAMTPAELEEAMASLDPADEADRLRRKGFYVDLEEDGISEPSQVTDAEVAAQLARARKATWVLESAILGPDFRAWLANPPDDGLELAQDLTAALIDSEHARTPRDATEVILQAVEKFRTTKI